MRIRDIMGKEVINDSAIVIGTVRDVEVNLETNEMESFIVGKGGLSESLGFSSSEVVIPYDMIHQIGDKVLLVTSETFEKKEAEPEESEEGTIESFRSRLNF